MEKKVIDVYKVDEKKSKILKNTLIILGCIVLCVLVLYLRGDIKFNYKLDLTPKSKIELKYTEVGSKPKDGVYITDVSEVVENVMPSIVAITSKTVIQSGMFGPSFFGYGNNRVSEGAGSGIIISETDSEILILTNNHVVADAQELTVKFIDDESVDAKIKGSSERKDVAVISVKRKDIKKSTLESIKIATIGDSNNLKVGSGIIAIGNALGYGQSVTTGVISALNRTLSGDDYSNKMIQIDAAINGGNSGGALLNSIGEVIGINSAKYSSSGSSSQASIEGMGFAIPISDVSELITDLMNGESEVDSGLTLGISGYMTNSSYISGYNFPTGFYVSEISSDGNAAKSELEIGNIITKVDEKEVTSVNTISNVLYDKKKGDKIKLTVKYPSGREYKEKTIEVTLSE